MWWFAKNNINVNIPSKNINIFDYRIFNIDTIKVAELYETAIDRLETITNNKTIDDLNINQYIKVYRDKLNDLDISTQTNIIRVVRAILQGHLKQQAAEKIRSHMAALSGTSFS